MTAASSVRIAHVSRRRIALIVIAAVLGAVGIAVLSVFELVAGNGTAKVPNNSALINLDGVAAAADGGRTVTIKLGKDAPQQFQGTTGCATRHFVAYYGGDRNSAMLLTYNKSQATLAYSSEVYRFDEGPQRKGSLLYWQGDFGPSGTFSQIILQVNCPPP